MLRPSRENKCQLNDYGTLQIFFLLVYLLNEDKPWTWTAARTAWSLCSSWNVGRWVSMEMVLSRGSDLLNGGSLPASNVARLCPGARRNIREQRDNSSDHDVSRSWISCTTKMKLTLETGDLHQCRLKSIFISGGFSAGAAAIPFVWEIREIRNWRTKSRRCENRAA